MFDSSIKTDRLTDSRDGHISYTDVCLIICVPFCLIHCKTLDKLNPHTVKIVEVTSGFILVECVVHN